MTTIALPTTERRAERKEEQYSLAKILSIWAVVSLPMPILAFVVAPALYSRVDLLPGIVYWILMILGMMWQFVVSLIIVYRELGTLRWSAIRERTWLTTPRDPQTGKSRPMLFWWLVPAFLFAGFVILGIGSYLDSATAWLFPSLMQLPSLSLEALNTPELIGAWWLVPLAIVSLLFNYFLGEEFLFRGVLLPKMQGAFGKWDWVMNAVLFGTYHLHKPLSIPGTILSSLAYSWPSRRFRSNWFAIILHGFEGVFVLVLVLGVVMGAAF